MDRVRQDRRQSLIRLLAGGAAMAGLAGGGMAWLGGRGLGGIAGPATRLPQAFSPVKIAAQDPVRILAFGTSLTARYDWPAALATRLDRCLGREVTAATLAASGQTSAWGRGQAGALIASRPDLVLMEFAVNDADLRHGIGLEQSLVQQAEILERIRAALPGTRVLLLGMNPVFGARALLRPRLAAYLGLYAQLAAADPRVGVLDLAPAWRAALAAAGPGGRARLLPDGLHPDPGAARAVILPVLGPALASLWGGSCGPDPRI